MAYGVNAPFGLQPRRYLNGAPWNGAVNTYNIASGYNTAIFTGDPVYLAAGTGLILAAAGDGNPFIGVFQGCKYYDTNANVIFSPYWPASTTVLTGTLVEAFVADDPTIIFDIQSNNTTGVTQAQLGKNAVIALGTGSTISGQSAVVLNLSVAPTTTATFQLKIMRLTPNPSNGFIGYNNVEVVINNHYYKGGTGTLGV